ncbi:MAG: hypothetical protein ACXWB9_04855 [Flavisolibacter sp.]
MTEYIIDVSRIEELQNLNNTRALDKIFERAQSTIVNGEIVKLIRKSFSGLAEPFDQITTLEELETYRKQVYKYIS